MSSTDVAIIAKLVALHGVIRLEKDGHSATIRIPTLNLESYSQEFHEAVMAAGDEQVFFDFPVDVEGNTKPFSLQSAVAKRLDAALAHLANSIEPPF